jgi:hypothetical protein
MSHQLDTANCDTAPWITLRWTRGTRYYRVHLEQDLWESWLLTHVNGAYRHALRQNSCPPTLEAALLTLAAVAKRRRQRGYDFSPRLYGD